ncbi:MAG: UDP-N-acetylmuramoyl-tripeptide--D-alanyl-D-alanine ligase [Prevotellaceae bacterium]|jgi:UDP-N-acetylmuramoyl-tripeptide--D-alanyl-D-alanine ligase|nr:UDP-N-acetylmuramoyl-tripeptide--D-alanyl-D-alanine ligase [Prevotellaceae bacterium]
MDISTLYACYQRCSTVVTDSRESVPQSLFFALKSHHDNGNRYAAAALSAGASFAIVDEKKYAVDERYLLVDDVLTALQQLAAHHRQQMAIPVIGITGTNGKTTTKELIAAVLSGTFTTLYTEGNKNNHIGVPLTLLRLTADHQAAVVEMGANHLREIADLCEIVAPDFGIITNVGEAHLEGFGSLDGVLEAKGALYRYIRQHQGNIFRNADNRHLAGISSGIREITYGQRREQADVSGQIVSDAPFITLSWHSARFNVSGETVHTHFWGSHNAENVLAAIAVGLYFGIDPQTICRRIESYIPQNNRSACLKTATNTLYLDAYNANPASMEAAIRSFKTMPVTNKTLILGEMLELGIQSEEKHNTIAALIRQLNFERVYLVGEAFASVAGAPFHTFPDVETLQQFLQTHPITDSAILIKGSRGVALEKAVAWL